MYQERKHALLTPLRGTIVEIGPEENSADAVISTPVFCSVPSIADLMKQVQQILKPDGTFIFIEHVADRKWTVRRIIQKATFFTPRRYFGDGCNPARDIKSEIDNAGFTTVNCENYLQNGAGIVSVVIRPHIAGTTQR